MDISFIQNVSHALNISYKDVNDAHNYIPEAISIFMLIMVIMNYFQLLFDVNN